MPSYSLNELLIICIFTALLSLSVVNIAVITQFKHRESTALKIKEQYSIILLSFCLVHLVTLVLQADFFTTHLTISFLYLLCPVIYYMGKADYKYVFYHKFRFILYGCYAATLLTFIVFFSIDYFELDFHPIGTIIDLPLLGIILYCSYLFIKKGILFSFNNFWTSAVLTGLTIITLLLIISCMIDYYIVSLRLLYYLFLILLTCLSFSITKSIIGQLIQYTQTSQTEHTPIKHSQPVELANTHTSASFYAKNTIESNKLNQIHLKLVDTPDTFFYNPDLNLRKLADHLGVSSYEMSFFFSNQYNTNFNQYVNTKRVLKAKQLLLDINHAHRSIKDIGQEVGFNSSASFYRAFKEHLKMPPSAFRKQKNN